MKGTKFISLLLAVLMIGGLMTACGGSSIAAPAYKADYSVVEETAAEAPMAMAMDAAANTSLTTNGSTGSGSVPENRKWIVTVDMSAETDDLDTLLTALDEKIASLEGYVENQSIYNGSNYSARRYRSANLTVRIPAQSVELFSQEVSGIANVVRKQVSKEDVTLRYVDTESRKKALETEQTRLLELMEQAQTMTDLLEIEGRLTDVRYQLESAASQLRTYDNQIDYATIYLNIEEVQEYTPVAEKTVWQRITDGFGDSLENLWESLVDIFVWIIVSSPFLLVYGGILVVIILLVRKFRKPRSEKRSRKPLGFRRKAHKTEGEVPPEKTE